MTTSASPPRRLFLTWYSLPRRTAGEAVAEVVGRAAAHRERVGAAAVPVADVHLVAGAAVGEREVGAALPPVGELEPVGTVADLTALGGGRRGQQRHPEDRARHG